MPYCCYARTPALLLRVMSIYSDWLLYFSSVLHLIPFHPLKSSKLAKLLCLSTCFPQYKNCVKFTLFVSAHVSVASLLHANSSQTFLVFQSWKEQEKPKVSAAADPCCLCVLCVLTILDPHRSPSLPHPSPLPSLSMSPKVSFEVTLPPFTLQVPTAIKALTDK